MAPLQISLKMATRWELQKGISVAYRDVSKYVLKIGRRGASTIVSPEFYDGFFFFSAKYVGSPSRWYRSIFGRNFSLVSGVSSVLFPFHLAIFALDAPGTQKLVERLPAEFAMKNHCSHSLHLLSNPIWFVAVITQWRIRWFALREWAPKRGFDEARWRLEIIARHDPWSYRHLFAEEIFIWKQKMEPWRSRITKRRSLRKEIESVLTADCHVASVLAVSNPWPSPISARHEWTNMIDT